MRTSIVAIPALALPILLVAAAVSPRPADAAGPGRWCSMSDDTGNINCNQPSFEMCLFTMMGQGGHCYLDGPARPPYREAVNYRAQAYVDPMGYSSNWRPRPAYAAQPFYQPTYYQPTYYQQPTYQRAYAAAPYYQPAYYQPGYYQPTYMNPVRMRPAGFRWCYQGNEPGTVDCNQPSFEMCRFSSYGSGGYCYQEQAFWGPSVVRAARLHAQHHFAHSARPQVADATARIEKPVVADAAKAAEPTNGAQAYALADASVSDAPLAVSPVKAAAPVVAKDFPSFNVAATCRQQAHIGLDPERDTAVCVQDENEARDQLVPQWNGFAADDRSSCKRLTTSTGGGTYTELVTCLEMRQFARNANK
jgi:hypothetical protein